MSAYTIGIDFGSLSARAAVIRVTDGKIMAWREAAYPHAIMTDALPDGTPLPPGFALQDPADYLGAMTDTVRAAAAASGARPEEIVGIGTDFTGSTMLPADESGTPLCMQPRFAKNPHAWVKMWKHHSAQAQADRITALCAERDPEILVRSGGRVSPESFFPKLWETLEEAPEVFSAAAYFAEAADWIVWQLTGGRKRSAAVAAYKELWRKETGFPAFLGELASGLADPEGTYLRGGVIPLGAAAGTLTPAMAEALGLRAGIPVVAGTLDAHCAVPGTGITGAGPAFLSVGTSSGVILCSPLLKNVSCACSVSEGGTLPGLYGYGNGQTCAGDLLGWYVKRGVPAAYEREAAERGVSVHRLLSERAAALRPGESGLVALEWWNGDKSLKDADLSGMILGMTLATRPEEIYRALEEAIAFGIRVITDAFAAEGIPVTVFHAGGGVSWKNPQFMQLICDVTGIPALMTEAVPTPAVGAAVFAAAAVGTAGGGWDTLEDAVAHMNCLTGARIDPDPAKKPAYDRLYAEYTLLRSYFAQGGNDVMKRLKRLAGAQKTRP